MKNLARRFEGKAIIITGAAGGIGLSTAIRLAQEGAGLTLVDINDKALDQAKNTLLKQVPDAGVIVTCAANVADEKEVINYVTTSVKKFGKIDGFFNNAGIDGKRMPLEDYSVEEFDRVMAINASGVFYGLKYVVEQMKKQGFGSIVNTASIGGLRGWGHQYGYVTSKHAVIGLTKATAVEFGPNNITVNAIAPGGIKTPMAEEAMRRLNPDDPEAAEREFAAAVPAKRMGTPEEIAAAVAFLLSEEASFINGHVLVVDGGQMVKQ
ncbi:MAG: glucose 1-dehydrogenase [Actinomycetaceae bacterium]|nr:glucose 1-dehydrogenase [Actinomycetaceae bacterium]